MPPSLTKVTPRVPAKLDRIVARALAKNPGDRYDSALEMANELIAVRASLHAGAPPAHMLSLRATIDTALASERSAASVRRRRRRAVVYGAGALAAVALLVAGWSLAPRAAPSRPAAPATGRSAVPPADSTAALEATTHRPAMAKPAEPPPRSDASTAHQSRTTDGSETRLRTRVPPGSGSAPVSGAGATGAAPRDVRRDPAGPSTASIPLADTMARGGSAPPKVSGTPGGGTLPAGEPRPQGPMPLVSAPQSPTAGAANATAPLASSPAAATSSTGSTSAKPDANTAPEIGAAIDAYAHAIESRDVAQLRQAFPAMTAEQQRAFADFFAGTRSLHASLAVSNLHVDGADATVRVTGSYEFVTTGGRDNRQAVAFQAELRYARGAWRLAVIR
jgi:serine/threonine-protein kinase